MTRSSWAQTDFTGGEFSQYLLGRADANRYRTGLQECQNYYALPQGPMVRRPGMTHVHITKDNGVADLKPFKYSISQTYQIEFGDEYLRFYRNNGLLLESSKTISGVTTGSTTVVTATAHGFSNGNRVYIQSIVSTGAGVLMEILNSREYVVANVTTDTFEIQVPPSTAIDSTTYNSWSSGGTVARIYEIVSPYTAAQVADIQITQSLDVLYLVHPSHPPRKLLRAGDTSWSFALLDFTQGPFLPINLTTTSLTPSAATGIVTITASSTTGINGGGGFTAGDVGRRIRLLDSALNWCVATITAVGTTTSITASLATNLSNTNAITTWRLDLWNAYEGYPSTIAFFEDRLCIGGNANKPQRVDGSRTGDYENFQPTDTDGTVGDDFAISFSLNSGDTNLVYWLATMRGSIFAGTRGGEWGIRSAYEDEPITPTSIFVDEMANYGSNNSRAIVASQSVLYIHRSKRQLREIVYERGAPRSPNIDLTELASHVSAGGLEQFVYQQFPHYQLWGRRTDGQFIGVAYQRTTENFYAGWQRHPLGGGTANGTDFFGDTIYGKVESLSVIPSVTTNRDETWMIVNRIVNGETVRSVEYMGAPFDEEVRMADAECLDCSRKFVSGSDITTLTGLYFWEGATLQTWVNGAAGPDITIENGAAALSAELEARTVLVGWGYDSIGSQLPPESGAADGGPAVLKPRRTHRIGVKLYRTLDMEITAAGADGGTLWDDAELVGADGFTGVKQVAPAESNTEFEGGLKWRQRTGAPGTIIAAGGFLDTQDGG